MHFYKLSALFLLSALIPLAAAPVRLIFDTDMGNDVDDAVALAMIHALESRGEAKLLAVTVTKDNRWAAPFVDLMDTFYGRPGIPIGVVRHGKTPEDSNMIRLPAERTRPDGSFVYPHHLVDGREIVCRRLAPRCPSTHDHAADRRVADEEACIRRERPVDLAEVLVEAAPVPRHAFSERADRHPFDASEHVQQVVRVLRAQRRDREATVAADHRRHTV